MPTCFFSIPQNLIASLVANVTFWRKTKQGPLIMGLLEGRIGTSFKIIDQAMVGSLI